MFLSVLCKFILLILHVGGGSRIYENKAAKIFSKLIYILEKKKLKEKKDEF